MIDSSFKAAVAGLSNGQRVVVEGFKRLDGGEVKVMAENNNSFQAANLGPAEAIALADALLAAAKYITAKRK